MVDKDMLEAMAQLLQPMNDRLDKVEQSIQEVKEETRRTQVLVESTNKNLKLICEAQQETAGKFKQLERVEMTLNDVKLNTEVIKDVVQWHSSDIKTLKKA